MLLRSHKRSRIFHLFLLLRVSTSSQLISPASIAISAGYKLIENDIKIAQAKCVPTVSNKISFQQLNKKQYLEINFAANLNYKNV